MDTRESEIRRGVQRFDVAILGSGIAGGTMACILAKHGLRVVIFDAHVHPRFALGESTIGETSCMLKLLAARYDVPELEHCSSVEGLEQHVASTCGMKLNFGFVYHREGKEQQPDESTQCSVNAFPFGPESHLYRQDVDAYLLYSAVRYGAVPRQQTVISKVEVASDGVRLETADHDVYEVDYVVDGTGHDSLLARTFDLRETPSRFKTNSRSLFTHMVGVPAFDEVISRSSGQPTPWSKGTLHHMFDGGWIWVIPFDNRPGSTNPLCSVGANLDARKFPRPTDITPQEEWDRLIARFPTVRKQFANAHPVRNWVSTGRIQYSSKQTVGDRWMLMSHAAGAVDALFSRGMANTLLVINSAAAMLLDAFKDRKDFSAQRFNYIERMNQTVLDFNDRLVHGAYVAFRDFDLWRAWSKVWFLSWHMGFTRIAGTLLDYYERGDRSVFSVFEEAKFPGSFCPDLPEFQETFASVVSVMDRVESGAIELDAAPAEFSRTFAQASFAPTPLNLWDVFRRFHDGTPASMRRMHDWGAKKAPAAIQRYYRYDFQRIVDRYGAPPLLPDAARAIQGGAA